MILGLSKDCWRVIWPIIAIEVDWIHECNTVHNEIVVNGAQSVAMEIENEKVAALLRNKNFEPGSCLDEIQWQLQAASAEY